MYSRLFAKKKKKKMLINLRNEKKTLRSQPTQRENTISHIKLNKKRNVKNEKKNDQ